MGDRGAPAVPGAARRRVRGRAQRHAEGRGRLDHQWPPRRTHGLGHLRPHPARAPADGPLAPPRRPGRLPLPRRHEGAGHRPDAAGATWWERVCGGDRTRGSFTGWSRPRYSTSELPAGPHARSTLGPDERDGPIRFLGRHSSGGVLGGASGSVFGAAATLWIGAAGMTLSFLPSFLSPLRTMRKLPEGKASAPVRTMQPGPPRDVSCEAQWARHPARRQAGTGCWVTSASRRRARQCRSRCSARRGTRDRQGACPGRTPGRP